MVAVDDAIGTRNRPICWSSGSKQISQTGLIDMTIISYENLRQGQGLTRFLRCVRQSFIRTQLTCRGELVAVLVADFAEVFL